VPLTLVGDACRSTAKRSCRWVGGDNQPTCVSALGGTAIANGAGYASALGDGATATANGNGRAAARSGGTATANGNGIARAADPFDTGATGIANGNARAYGRGTVSIGSGNCSAGISICNGNTPALP